MNDAKEVKARLSSPGGWRQVGSDDMGRYMKLKAVRPHGKGRRKCWCGCGGWRTHTGFANGVALTSGCEWSMRRWVKDGYDYPLREVGNQK